MFFGLWRHISKRAIIVSFLLVLSGIGATLIAVILFLLVKPFSRALYRRMVAQYVACMWLDAMSLLLPGANIQITGDSDMPDGITTGIVVANHQYEGDWWFMLMAARFLGVHGNVKIVVKEELKSIPLLGWILQLVEYPFISQSWSRSRSDLFSLLRSFTADSFPVLLFQFPEGDRIDANIRQQSIAFAEKERRPQLLHVLLPRTTGFNACIEALRTSHPVVYDMTIAFPGYTGQMPSAVSSNMETFWRFCNGEGPREVHVRFKRHQLEDVLGDPHWLDNRWAEKDRMLTYFGRTEQLPAQVNGRGRPGHPTSNAPHAPQYVRVFNSRLYKAEISCLALIRLCLTPLMLPCLLLMAWPALSLYFIVTTARRWVFGPDPGSPRDGTSSGRSTSRDSNETGETPQPIPTPFLPQTPFTSPLIGAFDMVGAPRRPSPQPKPVVSGEVGIAGMHGQGPVHKRILSRGFEMPVDERPPRAPLLQKAQSNHQLPVQPPELVVGHSLSSNSIITTSTGAAETSPSHAHPMSPWGAHEFDAECNGVVGGGEGGEGCDVYNNPYQQQQPSPEGVTSSGGNGGYTYGFDDYWPTPNAVDHVSPRQHGPPAAHSPPSPTGEATLLAVGGGEGKGVALEVRQAQQGKEHQHLGDREEEGVEKAEMDDDVDEGHEQQDEKEKEAEEEDDVQPPHTGEPRSDGTEGQGPMMLQPQGEPAGVEGVMDAVVPRVFDQTPPAMNGEVDAHAPSLDVPMRQKKNQ